ncbi:hypothetical protein NL108_006810 [Boleophthalmus pectinirostris]|uniref:outer dynein arm-docking complex subunit 1-like n=1 Tax=Boleophthalmus pectinirostris TaxID=150288 RepID=UPI0024320615|nr:outer dynein arm-docking complex subunit 1-like [Boleophthalmus pectinirostris]KAJ0068415.1 hypothetical protein NL108_006810 [Boleophthalmus pectinirostris]
MQKGKAPASQDADATEEQREQYTKLRSRLRQLETEREVQRRQAQNQIWKQEQEIERLVLEQDRLKRELSMRNGGIEQNCEQETADKLQELMQHCTSIDQELESEAQKQKDLNKQISDLQPMLLDLRKDKEDAQRSRRKNIKQRRILEDKVHRATTKFNEQVSRNSELRKEIQTVIGDMARWQAMIKSKKKEALELREAIKTTTDEYLAACEASVRSHQKSAEMRETLAKERTDYDTEMQRLQLVDNYEDALTHFISTKQDGREPSHGHRQVTKTKETKESPEEVLDRIRSVTGEENVDNCAEDHIVTVFKSVNEQNNEIALSDGIEQVQAELEKFEVRSQERKQRHRVKIAELSKQLEEVEERTAHYEEQARVKSDILERLKTGLSSISSKIDCDKGEDDFSSLMGAVDQRTNEMLTIKAWLDKERESH